MILTVICKKVIVNKRNSNNFKVCKDKNMCAKCTNKKYTVLALQHKRTQKTLHKYFFEQGCFQLFALCQVNKVIQSGQKPRLFLELPFFKYKNIISMFPQLCCSPFDLHFALNSKGGIRKNLLQTRFFFMLMHYLRFTKYRHTSYAIYKVCCFHLRFC